MPASNALRNVLSETITAFDKVRRWGRTGLAVGLDLGGRLLALLAPAAAAFCFSMALMLVHPNGLARLSARYCDLISENKLVHLVNLAFWPLHYAWMIAAPAPGLEGHQMQALLAITVGVALLVIVNIVNLRRQTLKNSTGKIAVALWAVAVVLTLGDFARCIWLPVSWDTTPLLGDITNSMVLRSAEILATTYVWSLHLVTSRSRADVGTTRTWAMVSTKTRRALAINGALLFAFTPLSLGLLQWAATANAVSDPFPRYVIVGGIVTCLIIIAVGPLFNALRLLLSFLLSLISDGDLLVERVAPPERPNRW